MKQKGILFLLSMLPAFTFADIDREIALCAVKQGDLARLACYDGIAEKHGLSGPQSEPTGITDSGKWSVSSKTNPVDDSRTVTLYLVADSGKSKWGRPVSMILRCKSNKTELYINWNDYLGSSAHVLTRIGTSPAETESWSLSTDSQSTFLPGRSIKKLDFIEAMMRTNKFVAQVTPYNESPVTAIFDTTGLRIALKPLRETCGW